jgi:hypothetical protein
LARVNFWRVRLRAGDIAVKDIDPITAKALIYRRLLHGTVVVLVGILVLVVAGLVFVKHLGGIPFSLACGCLGANLSLFRRLRLESDQRLAIMAQDWNFTLLPMVYGGIAGAVMYLLFMSGILSYATGDGLFTSNLFPLFSEPDKPPGEPLSIRTILSIRPVEVRDFGKLLIWAFVAGYSERFVTGILDTLENKK